MPSLYDPRPLTDPFDVPCPECDPPVALLQITLDAKLRDPVTGEPPGPYALLCPACGWKRPMPLQPLLVVTSPPF